MDNRLKAGIGATVAAISAAGLLFIGSWEGKRNDPYRDIAGVWTVCYGSTGAHVLPGGTRTDAECTTLLREDVVRFERAVKRCTPRPKNQNQFDAMVSLSFNIGESAYCRSSFARKFNAGDNQGAADAILLWNKARVNGQLVTVRGLARRREAERALFLREPDFRAVEPGLPMAVSTPSDPVDGAGRGGNRGS
jgi:lysozyme